MGAFDRCEYEKNAFVIALYYVTLRTSRDRIHIPS